MAVERRRARITTALVNICSFTVAAIFIFSGFTKGADPVGGGMKTGEYLRVFGIGLAHNEGLCEALSVFQSAAEFMLGVCLLLGIRRRLTTLLLLAAMLFMTALTLYTAITGAVSDCGCFGDAVRLDNWQTLYKNIVLLAMTAAAAAKPGKICKALGAKSERAAGIYALAAILWVNLYSLHYLPIVDFRPFHVGQDIRRAMEIPEDAEPPVYETVFTLRKGGEQRTFTIDDYPDSTWQFVSSETKILKKGFEPEIADFALFDCDTGEDKTMSVLFENKFAFWLIMSDIKKADNGVIDAIGDIYDYCRLNGYGIYGLTASGKSQIAEWKHSAGIDFPFYQADGTTLNTVVRSNPGLLLVRKGKILNKWGKNSLPDDETLTAPIEKLASSRGMTGSGLAGAVKYLVCFIVPLIILIFADKFGKRRKPHTPAAAQDLKQK